MTDLNLRIDIKNSYGIEGLLETLLFTEKKNVYAIYGSNGIGKTSLTKSFKDFSINKSGDFGINKITGKKIKIKLPKTIDFLVLESIVQKNLSFGKKTLSVSVEEQVILNILEKEIDFLFKKCIPKINESEIKKIFFNNQDFTYEDFTKAILEFKEMEFDLELSIKNNYKNIFNDKVKNFLKTNIRLIQEYIEKYKILEKESHVLKNEFDYQNSKNLIKSLKDTKFLNVGGIYFKNDLVNIDTIEKIEKIIELEINKIIEDNNLKEKFSKIEEELDKNKELKNFKDWLKINQKWVKLFENYETFQQNVIFKTIDLENITLLAQKISDYNDLIPNSEEIEKKWQNTLRNFKNTFITPINLKIEKVKGHISSKQNLEIVFNYEQETNKQSNTISEEDIWQTLSQGEVRTVYLLDIMYRIQELESKDTVIIFDDIVDSFDYKNKQAIINYFCKLKREGYKFIILTHNFDFFRTLDYKIKPVLLYMKKTEAIDAKTKTPFKRLQFCKFNENYDVFKDWLKPKKIEEDISFLFANIAFTRQLANYHGEMDLKLFCTQCLHIKKQTDKLTIGHIYEKICIFNKIEINNDFLEKNKNKKYKDSLYNYCDKIINLSEDNFLTSLKDKVCLSIGIRLKAEEYMISKLLEYDKSMQDKILKISDKQTYTLFSLCLDNKIEINELLINKVNTFTSESIHLNSFMFEPLLDLEIEQLIKIYEEIKGLI